MEAMVLEGFGAPLRRREVSEPLLGPQDILVKVKACGVCRTDIKITDGKMPAFYEWNVKGCCASTRQELEEVVRLVEAKRIKPVVSRTYPMHQANEALEDLKKGDVVGRIVLVQDE